MEYEAKFDFTPNDADELPFKKSDVLKVIRREDKHWLLAHLGAKQGLIPENYLSIVRPHPWYVGKITRKLAEEYLMAMPSNGAFLIRDSESNPDAGNFSLSVKFMEGVQHFKILTDLSGKYFLWVVKFNSLNELVDYHRANSVSRTQEIYLTEPCVPLDNNDQQQQQQPPQQQQQPPQQAGMKCKALFDFVSDVDNELSFRQNDIIFLVARPHADWWEGEIRGPTGNRRGIFPKNYVTEVNSGMHR